MADSIIRKQILDHLDHMPYELQKKVLDFVKTVDNSETLKGVPGSVLLKYSGIIDEESAREMEEAIEEECERV